MNDLKNLLGTGYYENVPMIKLGTKVKKPKLTILPSIVKPTKTFKRAKDWALKPLHKSVVCCGTMSPGDLLWCERVKGHKGLHLAWTNYETGQLYDGGAWK